MLSTISSSRVLTPVQMTTTKGMAPLCNRILSSNIYGIQLDYQVMAFVHKRVRLHLLNLSSSQSPFLVPFVMYLNHYHQHGLRVAKACNASFARGIAMLHTPTSHLHVMYSNRCLFNTN